MTTVTKFEMDEKLSKMNNLIMSFMDCTNNKIKLMEEEIKQNKNKINILEKELNDTKTNNQEYKHKINILENELNDSKTNNQEYKHKINILENELNDTKTNNQEYKHKINIHENDLILTPKQPTIYITEDKLMMTSVSYSTILKCNIKDVEGNIISNGETKYHHILLDIFKKMDRSTIANYSSFNVKPTDEKGVHGYYWVDDLELSIQHRCANATLKEIIRMIKYKKYTIKISIQLKADEIIHFKN
jgi:hypothetical protein